MPSAPLTTPPRPTLFVLSTTEPDAVLDFYDQVCGWKLEPSSAAAMGRAAGAGEQAFFVRKGPVGWLPFLSVADLQGALDRAKAAGGRGVFPLPDDDTGRSAAVFDPSDTRLGLWAVDDPDMNAAGQSIEHGQIIWMEEKTRDQQAAAAFHSEVFGFAAAGPTGPGKVQLLRGNNGPSYAGVMQFDERWAPDHPPHWLLYMSVDDLDKTIEQALAAGGSVWFEPTDTPLGGLAYLRDPAGNAFAVVEVAEAARGMLFAGAN